MFKNRNSIDYVKTDEHGKLVSNDEAEGISIFENRNSIDYVKTDEHGYLVSNDEAEDDSSLTMILVGKSKSGISTIAKMFNTYKEFEANQNKSCGVSTGFVNSRKTTLVDIPGFFAIEDKQKRAGKLLRSYTQSITTEIILFVVLRVGSVTKYDIKVFNLIRDLNSQRKILQNIVILTCNESDAESFTVENFKQQSSELSGFITSCNCKICVFHFSTKKESENAESFFRNLDGLIDEAITCKENTTIMNESCDKVDQGKLEQMGKHSKSRIVSPKESTPRTLFRKRMGSNFDSLKEKQDDRTESVKQQDSKQKKKRRNCLSACTLL